MSFIEDLKPWKEYGYGAVSNQYNPKYPSCDNGILFSAEACIMGGFLKASFEGLCLRYEASPGCLRYTPDRDDICSWDDHLGASVASPYMARRILAHGEANSWNFGGKKLWRFPLFIPTVRAAAGVSLSWYHHVMAASAFIFNIFEKKEETSGKILLWLASKVLYDKSWFLNKAIDSWRWSMRNKYPNGPEDMLKIYFPNKDGHIHPLVLYCPSKFDTWPRYW